jgi:hypothetical protein
VISRLPVLQLKRLPGSTAPTGSPLHLSVTEQAAKAQCQSTATRSLQEGKVTAPSPLDSVRSPCFRLCMSINLTWLSRAGFQAGSTMTTRSAAVNVRPRPPTCSSSLGLGKLRNAKKGAKAWVVRTTYRVGPCSNSPRLAVRHPLLLSPLSTPL